MGDSRVIALGDFTSGGDLLVRDRSTNKPLADDEEGIVRHNCHDVWLKFDGKDWHKVTDITGERFSVVFFQLGQGKIEERKPATIPPQLRAKLTDLGMNLPVDEGDLS